MAARWQAPDGFYLVSEPTFVPKVGSEAGEGDEGYLLLWVSAASEEAVAEARGGAGRAVPEPADGRSSRLYVVDAASMREGASGGGGGASAGDSVALEAVAALELPGAVPYGLHSCWLDYEDLPCES